MTHVGAGKLGARVLAALFISLLALAVACAQPSRGAVAGTAGRSAAAERTEKMTIPAAAKAYLSRILKKEYGKVWNNGSHKTWKSCRNVSRSRVSCKVSWRSGRYLYSGKVYVDYRAADPERVAFSISGFGRKLV